jgi:hypothetical protein
MRDGERGVEVQTVGLGEGGSHGDGGEVALVSGSTVSVKTGGEGVAVESGGGVDVERGAEMAVKLPVAAVSPLDRSRVCRWGLRRR